MADGFDPDRATRQTFVDVMLSAFRLGNEGYGWHLVEMGQSAGKTTLVFETPHPLRGWRGKEDFDGPHKVYVEIRTVNPETIRGLAKLAEAMNGPFRIVGSEVCPDCHVQPGSAHAGGCDVARCSRTGTQRLMCPEYGSDSPTHDCGADVWRGRRQA